MANEFIDNLICEAAQNYRNQVLNSVIQKKNILVYAVQSFSYDETSRDLKHKVVDTVCAIKRSTDKAVAKAIVGGQEWITNAALEMQNSLSGVTETASNFKTAVYGFFGSLTYNSAQAAESSAHLGQQSGGGAQSSDFSAPAFSIDGNNHHSPAVIHTGISGPGQESYLG